MVHFTTFQRYGFSRSHYSLADHLDVDPFFFSELGGDQLHYAQKLELIAEVVSSLR